MRYIKIIKEIPFVSPGEIGNVWMVDDYGNVKHPVSIAELNEKATFLVELGLAVWIDDEDQQIIKSLNVVKGLIEEALIELNA